MHGQNRIRKREGAGFELQVAEIFYTIQGEGPYMGYTAVFVRLSGCPLRCTFCDTQWDDDNDPKLNLSEILTQIRGVIPEPFKAVPLIVLTGGEPLRQPLVPLVTELAKEFPRTIVQIETSGVIYDPVIYEPNVSVVVSPKTPKISEEVWNRADAFKYVIRFGKVAPEDGLPVGGTQPENSGKYQLLARPRPGSQIFLSPCDEGSPEANARNYTLAAHAVMKYGYRLSLQMHKLVGVR